MRTTSAAIVMAALVLAATAASAQSLAALADLEAARRAALAEPARVYTNQDLTVWPAPTPPRFPPMPFVPDLERTPIRDVYMPIAPEPASGAGDSSATMGIGPWWAVTGLGRQWAPTSRGRRGTGRSAASPFDAASGGRFDPRRMAASPCVWCDLPGVAQSLWTTPRATIRRAPAPRPSSEGVSGQRNWPAVRRPQAGGLSVGAVATGLPIR